ncbi:MAG: UvrD-helicase domain-containing protein [Lachnospiraceae bacterium]|nr:UvrD-helicase domain-containing protein [Lachnospiraceae bacterium]
MYDIDILEGLNDMQKKAVQCTEGPLLILAGAGSGKTRVLTYRVAYLISECNVSPYNIMAVTFTNKAAKELKERIDHIVGPGSEAVWASTFHSTCVKILRRFIERLGYSRDFIIYDRDDQKALMKNIIKSMNLDPKKYKDNTFLNVISSAKDELIGPQKFSDIAGNDPQQRLYARAYDEYQKRLMANNALDFDDLIFMTVRLFRESSETLEYYRRRFRYIMVDEYQDTNTAQFELIRLLAEFTDEYGYTVHNLCVVGDDDQSIYKFRGANIRNILEFEENYPDATVIRLEQNYRSTESILDTANEVIKNNQNRKAKRLWTQNGPGKPVSYTSYPSDKEEAAEIISQIYDEVRNGYSSYKDYAILYRTNAQSRLFEERLIMRGVPYRIIGSINFYQRKEIKDLLAYLRVLSGSTDDISVRRIINIPKRGVGNASLDKITAYANDNNISLYRAFLNISRDEQIAKSLKAGRSLTGIKDFVTLIESYKKRLETISSLTDYARDLLESIDYDNYLKEDDDDLKVEERKENLEELFNKIADYENMAETGDEPPSLSGFLEEVALVGDIDSYSEESDVVVLMTIHSAKGLEFDNVFLVGMEENIFPSALSINSEDPEEEIAEERRLCYVGITRARKNLYLSSAITRMMHGNIVFNAQSRFIREIPRHLLSMKGAGGRANTISGNKAIANLQYRNTSSRPVMTSIEDNHSRAFREKDAGHYNPKVTLNDNPYISMPSKGISSSINDADDLGFKVGDRVKHIKFGTGIVAEITKGEKDFEVSVDFSSGRKRMLASFAKLKKAED